MTLLESLRSAALSRGDWGAASVERQANTSACFLHQPFLPNTPHPSTCTQRMVVDGIQRGEAVSLARAGAAGDEAAVPKVEASGASALELEKARSAAAVTGGASEAEAIDARREGKSVVEARRHTTAREVARRVYSESGLRGFYRGFGVSVLQFAPTSAVSVAAAVMVIFEAATTGG